jgi:hypothetical protein
MTYAIRRRKKRGKDGYQVVMFMLPTYFTIHGYPADEHDVKDGWFEDRDDAVVFLSDLEYDEDEN